jgi:hypothetical protein
VTARTADIVIDCHIDDVFAFLADLTNAPRWAAGVVAVDQITGDGPGLGALYHVERRRRGRRRRAAVVCVGFQPPERVAWRQDEGETSYELEPVWTATRVTVRGGGAVRDLRGLRRVLEGR